LSKTWATRPRAGRALVFLAAGLVLAACNSATRPLADGTATPGIDASGSAVDGLTVGHRLMQAGEFELALKSYFRAAGDEGFTPEVLASIGSANLRLGRLGQAEEILRRAVAENQRLAPAWNNLGVVLIERGEDGEAREAFKRAFALDGGRSDDIKRNLNLAIAKTDLSGYDVPEEAEEFSVRPSGATTYRLIYAE
jgi:tetratricopeptide (TPR) repeat protein